jgi:hypothetical protein
MTPYGFCENILPGMMSEVALVSVVFLSRDTQHIHPLSTRWWSAFLGASRCVFHPKPPPLLPIAAAVAAAFHCCCLQTLSVGKDPGNFPSSAAHCADPDACFCCCCCCCCCLQTLSLGKDPGNFRLRLPTALILSQFHGVKMPHPVRLELVVDGRPVGECVGVAACRQGPRVPQGSFKKVQAGRAPGVCQSQKMALSEALACSGRPASG